MAITSDFEDGLGETAFERRGWLFVLLSLHPVWFEPILLLLGLRDLGDFNSFLARVVGAGLNCDPDSVLREGHHIFFLRFVLIPQLVDLQVVWFAECSEVAVRREAP